jgi:hypothetical protein
MAAETEQHTTYQAKAGNVDMRNHLHGKAELNDTQARSRAFLSPLLTWGLRSGKARQ